MSTFVSNFALFFNAFLGAVSDTWTWLISTIIGQVIVFMVIISLFMFLFSKLTKVDE